LKAITCILQSTVYMILEIIKAKGWERKSAKCQRAPNVCQGLRATRYGAQIGNVVLLER
jgi:hypothetical protein